MRDRRSRAHALISSDSPATQTSRNLVSVPAASGCRREGATNGANPGRSGLRHALLGAVFPVALNRAMPVEPRAMLNRKRGSRDIATGSETGDCEKPSN